MNEDTDWLWVRIRRRTLEAARRALKIFSMELHREARMDPDQKRKEHLRAEADYNDLEAEEIHDATEHGWKDKP